MTIIAGDTGHVTDHNTLWDRAEALCVAWGVDVTRPGPFAIDDPSHIARGHNDLVTALTAVASAADTAVTLPTDDIGLGDSGHVTDHNLFETALDTLDAVPIFSNGTGGTTVEYTVSGHKYRLHKFESAGSFDFTVTRGPAPFRLVYVGAGGGGGASDGTYNGGGGDGGYGGEVTGITLAAGVYPIVVGTGSTGDGAASTALGYTGAGGAGGVDGYGAHGPSGTTRGPASTIRDGVTSEQFGLRGGVSGSEPSATPTPGHGASGAYAGGGPAARIGSYPGGVWISYEIAP